jgi:hypothetical protein
MLKYAYSINRGILQIMLNLWPNLQLCMLFTIITIWGHMTRDMICTLKGWEFHCMGGELRGKQVETGEMRSLTRECISPLESYDRVHIKRLHITQSINSSCAEVQV